MNTLQTKFCIIGAGPAGSTTSLFLSKMQVPHVIVDASVFPRDKICGDALDLKVIRVLNQLDREITKELLNDENFAKAWGASIIISKNQKHSFYKPTDGYPFFMVSKRSYFDNFLVSKTNSEYADLIQGTKVQKLTRGNNQWKIEAENNEGKLLINADMIVGADGDHSVVLRSLGERKIDRHNYAAALRQYWRGVTDLHSDHYLEVYFSKSLPLAYLWIFPLPNGDANVGCGLVSDIVAKKGIDLKKLFNQLIFEDEALAHRFKNATPLEKPVGWGLPFVSQKRKASGDGYLLTGDAAALVSPLTGEGVGPAMMSGYIAAKFIERAIKANDFTADMFKNYDREIYKRYRDEVRNYKILRAISPKLYNMILKRISGYKITHQYFNKNASRWNETADKPINVEF